MSTTGQITVRQWFALPKDERVRRAYAFRKADAALQGNGWETREDALNGTVTDLWPTVPWWVRSPALPHVAEDIHQWWRR